MKWRNYEASYDAFELEPTSRENYTYVLQEYFVPIGQIDSFVPRMAKIFQQHRVNVINISIQHARPDKGSLMACAPSEVFCFVVYYKQETTMEEGEKVREWTRELIDVPLAEGGPTTFLPDPCHPATICPSVPKCQPVL